MFVNQNVAGQVFKGPLQILSVSSCSWYFFYLYLYFMYCNKNVEKSECSISRKSELGPIANTGCQCPCAVCISCICIFLCNIYVFLVFVFVFLVFAKKITIRM